MGAIQNAINQTLGAAAGAATAATYLGEKLETQQLRHTEASQEVMNAEHELNMDNNKVSEQISNGELTDISDAQLAELNEIASKDGDVASRLIEMRAENAKEGYKEAYAKDLLNRVNGASEAQVQQGSIRLEMARKAYMEAEDAVNARKNLKFNLEEAVRHKRATGTVVQNIKSRTEDKELLRKYGGNK